MIGYVKISGRPRKALGNITEGLKLFMLDGDDDEEHRDQSTNTSQYNENSEFKVESRILYKWDG